ncbi:YfiR family protein [Glaciimonas sp. PCH181]|uniref:YfiR family protein n=1 Tax=Glaciimonas sp. PCH181 TaxID=2133943 RepID=UPI001375127A|nr:YfiR family protein [Glaciimonas sp. PCH181]
MHKNVAPLTRKRNVPLTRTPCARENFLTQFQITSRMCIALFIFLTTTFSSIVQAQNNATELQRAQNISHVIIGISSYVRWPTPSSELRLCVVGEAKYAGVLMDSAKESSVPPIRAHQLSPKSDVTSAECNIVYIGNIDGAEREKLFAQLNGQPILSISEPGLPSTTRSMFSLKFRDTQIAFEVNLDAIARSGLRVHPNVLQFAKREAQKP